MNLSYNSRKGFYLRAISVLTLVAFLSSDLLSFSSPAFAQTGSSLLIQEGRNTHSALELVIPSEIGSITEIYHSTQDREIGIRENSKGSRRTEPESRFVFLIQDAHSIPDAQRSLEKLIEYLQENYGVRTVALEGAEGKLDPELFRTFPDRQRINAVLAQYLEKGELSGAAVASVLSRFPGDYVGVEDWKLYQESVVAFLSGLRKQSVLEAQFALLNSGLQGLKAKYYSKEALEFDSKYREWQAEPAHLSGFLEYLSEAAVQNSGIVGKHLHLNAIIKSLAQEKVPEPRLEAEVKRFAQYAHAMVPSPALNRLVQGYRTGSITSAALAYEITGLLQKAGKPFPSISAGFRRVISNHDILVKATGQRLDAEIDAFVREFKKRLMPTSEAQAVDELDGQLRLVEKLSKFELSRNEWTDVRNPLIEIRGLPQEMQDQVSALRGQTVEFQRFYELAEAREAVFLKKLNSVLSGFTSQTRNPVVFIAGGFHTSGISHRLKEQGISYAVISPSMKEVPQDHRYFDHMRGKVSWRGHFRPRNGKIDLYDAFARAVVEQLASQGTESRHWAGNPSSVALKEWRDEIIRMLAAKGRVEEHVKYTRYIDQAMAEHSEEFRTLKTKWIAQLEKFIESLQLLGKNNQITETNVSKLLSAATNHPYALSMILGKTVPAEWVYPEMSTVQGGEDWFQVSDQGPKHFRYARSESRDKKNDKIPLGREIKLKLVKNAALALFQISILLLTAKLFLQLPRPDPDLFLVEKIPTAFYTGMAGLGYGGAFVLQLLINRYVKQRRANNVTSSMGDSKKPKKTGGETSPRSELRTSMSFHYRLIPKIVGVTAGYLLDIPDVIAWNAFLARLSPHVTIRSDTSMARLLQVGNDFVLAFEGSVNGDVVNVIWNLGSASASGIVREHLESLGSRQPRQADFFEVASPASVKIGEEEVTVAFPSPSEVSGFLQGMNFDAEARLEPQLQGSRSEMRFRRDHEATRAEMIKVAEELKHRLGRLPTSAEVARGMQGFAGTKSPVQNFSSWAKRQWINLGDHGIVVGARKLETQGRDRIHYEGMSLYIPEPLLSRVKVVLAVDHLEFVDLQDEKNRVFIQRLPDKPAFKCWYTRPDSMRVESEMSYEVGQSMINLHFNPVFCDFIDTVLGIPLSSGVERENAVADYLSSLAEQDPELVSYVDEKTIKFRGYLEVPQFYETIPKRLQIFRDRQVNGRWLILQDVRNLKNHIGFEWRNGAVTALRTGEILEVASTVTKRDKEIPRYILTRTQAFKEFDSQVRRPTRTWTVMPGGKRHEEVGFGLGRFLFRVKGPVDVTTLEEGILRQQGQISSNDRINYPIELKPSRSTRSSTVYIRYYMPETSDDEFTVEGLTWDDGSPAVLKGRYFNLSTIVEMIRRGLLPGVHASMQLLDMVDYVVPRRILNGIRTYRVDPIRHVIVEDSLVHPASFRPWIAPEARSEARAGHQERVSLEKFDITAWDPTDMRGMSLWELWYRVQPILWATDWSRGELDRIAPQERLAFFSRAFSLLFQRLNQEGGSEDALEVLREVHSFLENVPMHPEIRKMLESYLGLYELKAPASKGKGLVSYVVSMYGEQHRLQPKTSENPHGEDALAMKIRQLEEHFAVNPAFDWELILVDDGEKDPSYPEKKSSGDTVLEILQTQFPELLSHGKIKVLFLPRDQKLAIGGTKGSGVVYGMRQALNDGADALFYTDLDLSTHLALSGRSLKMLYGGKAGVVIGSRRDRDSNVYFRSPREKLNSTLYNLAVRTLLGFSYQDTQAGFKVFTRELMEKIIPLSPEGMFDEDFVYNFSFDTNFLLRAHQRGARIVTVPLVWVGSQEETKVNPERARAALRGLWTQHGFLKQLNVKSKGQGRVPFRSEMRTVPRNAKVHPEKTEQAGALTDSELRVFQQYQVLPDATPFQDTKKDFETLVFYQWGLPLEVGPKLVSIPASTLYARKSILTQLFLASADHFHFHFNVLKHPEILGLPLDSSRINRLKKAMGMMAGDNKTKFESQLIDELKQAGVQVEDGFLEDPAAQYWVNASGELAMEKERYEKREIVQKRAGGGYQTENTPMLVPAWNELRSDLKAYILDPSKENLKKIDGRELLLPNLEIYEDRSNNQGRVELLQLGGEASQQRSAIESFSLVAGARGKTVFKVEVHATAAQQEKGTVRITIREVGTERHIYTGDLSREGLVSVADSRSTTKKYAAFFDADSSEIPQDPMAKIVYMEKPTSQRGEITLFDVSKEEADKPKVIRATIHPRFIKFPDGSMRTLWVRAFIRNGIKGLRVYLSREGSPIGEMEWDARLKRLVGHKGPVFSSFIEHSGDTTQMAEWAENPENINRISDAFSPVSFKGKSLALVLLPGHKRRGAIVHRDFDKKIKYGVEAVPVSGEKRVKVQFPDKSGKEAFYFYYYHPELESLADPNRELKLRFAKSDWRKELPPALIAYSRYDAYLSLADPTSNKPALNIYPDGITRGEPTPLFITFRMDEQEHKSLAIYGLDEWRRPSVLLWEGYFDEARYAMVQRHAGTKPRKLEGDELYQVQLEAWRLRYVDILQGRPQNGSETPYFFFGVISLDSLKNIQREGLIPGKTNGLERVVAGSSESLKHWFETKTAAGLQPRILRFPWREGFAPHGLWKGFLITSDQTVLPGEIEIWDGKTWAPLVRSEMRDLQGFIKKTVEFGFKSAKVMGWGVLVLDVILLVMNPLLVGSVMGRYLLIGVEGTLITALLYQLRGVKDPWKSVGIAAAGITVLALFFHVLLPQFIPILAFSSLMNLGEVLLKIGMRTAGIFGGIFLYVFIEGKVLKHTETARKTPLSTAMRWALGDGLVLGVFFYAIFYPFLGAAVPVELHFPALLNFFSPALAASLSTAILKLAFDLTIVTALVHGPMQVVTKVVLGEMEKDALAPPYRHSKAVKSYLDMYPIIALVMTVIMGLAWMKDPAGGMAVSGTHALFAMLNAMLSRWIVTKDGAHFSGKPETPPRRSESRTEKNDQSFKSPDGKLKRLLARLRTLGSSIPSSLWHNFFVVFMDEVSTKPDREISPEDQAWKVLVRDLVRRWHAADRMRSEARGDSPKDIMDLMRKERKTRAEWKQFVRDTKAEGFDHAALAMDPSKPGRLPKSSRPEAWAGEKQIRGLGQDPHPIDGPTVDVNRVETQAQQIYEGMLDALLKRKPASEDVVQDFARMARLEFRQTVDGLRGAFENFAPAAFAEITGGDTTLAAGFEALQRVLRVKNMTREALDRITGRMFDRSLRDLTEAIQKREVTGLAPVVVYSPEISIRLRKFIDAVQRGFDAAGDETGKQYRITLVSENKVELIKFKTELSKAGMLRGVHFIGDKGSEDIAAELALSVIRHPVFGSKFGIFFPEETFAPKIQAWQRVVRSEIPKEYAILLLPELSRYFAQTATSDINATTLRHALPDLFASAAFRVGRGIAVVAVFLEHIAAAERSLATAA